MMNPSESRSGTAARYGLQETGGPGPALLLANGYGCHHGMWDAVLPLLTPHFRVFRFDYPGTGEAPESGYSAQQFSSLQGYADVLLEVAEAIGEPVIAAGHSVSAIIAVLAAARKPALFRSLVLVSPSPCFLNDGDYRGGFERTDLEEMLETLERNYLGWTRFIAPVLAGNGDTTGAAGRLEESFCSMRPDIARQFASVTFLSDHRADLAACPVPALVIQVSQDAIAPVFVGKWTAARLPAGSYAEIDGFGHCPHMTHPGETAALIRRFASGNL